MSPSTNGTDPNQLAEQIRRWSRELGFQAIGITDTDPGEHEAHLRRWLEAGFHGEMDYMAKHGQKRTRPEQLIPDTLRVISVRMDYLPAGAEDAEHVLSQPELAYISRYALGRDYHKLMRQGLKRLTERIEQTTAGYDYRVFVDSAPVMERAFAEKAGLGWIGKHTNLMSRDTGSWFFLGEIYTNIPLPVTGEEQEEHCGTCTNCIDVCPTDAIVAPYRLDARRCISYLTIELRGSIPLEFRDAIGNRIYGCDDCQLFCPWNRFAKISSESDFTPRHELDASTLVSLFGWDEDTFLQRTEGSAIRRIGYDSWLRNIAIALGNCGDPGVVDTLKRKRASVSELVAEHIDWAVEKLRSIS